MAGGSLMVLVGRDPELGTHALGPAGRQVEPFGTRVVVGLACQAIRGCGHCNLYSIIVDSMHLIVSKYAECDCCERGRTHTSAEVSASRR